MRFLIVLYVILFASGAMAENPVAKPGMEEIRHELSSLAVERAEIVKQLQASRELQAANGATAAKLLLEFERLVEESKAIETLRVEQDKACSGGTYSTQAEADAANARCAALADPFDKRVGEFNAAEEKAKNEQKAIEDSEQKRIAAARPLVDRYDAIRKRAAALTKLIPAEERKECVKSCASDEHSPESATKCLQQCWDGAGGGEENPADVVDGRINAASGPVLDMPKQDVTRLGDRVARVVMDSIVHGDHDLAESKRILWRVLQAQPDDPDYRDAYSYIDGMELGHTLSHTPSPKFTPEEYHRMAPKVRMDDAITFVTMVAGEIPTADQIKSIKKWDQDVFEAFWEVHKEHPQNFTAVREELEKRAKADPENTVLRGALRQAQGAEVYQDDINKYKESAK